MNISKATVARIVAKCSDLCSVTLLDDQNTPVAEHRGYVPDFMPGEHYGDYVEIDVELSTGKILNWVKPTQEGLQKPTRHEDWKEP